jgi:cytochrome c biogenesis protein CcmG/thiol:disulfide interchange protein DsbE
MAEPAERRLAGEKRGMKEMAETKSPSVGIRGWQIALLAGILGLIVLFYKGLWGNPSYIPPVLVGTQAPEITAPDLYQPKEVSLSQFRGKVVVLNFWASWCQECKLEHQNLLAIQKRFGQNPNFVMLGVNYQDKEDLARQYLQEHGNNFEHIRDVKGRISIDYGVYGVPETFVIDQNGVIRHKQIGPIVGETYTFLVERLIEPLLNGTATTS